MYHIKNDVRDNPSSQRQIFDQLISEEHDGFQVMSQLY